MGQGIIQSELPQEEVAFTLRYEIFIPKGSKRPVHFLVPCYWLILKEPRYISDGDGFPQVGGIL